MSIGALSGRSRGPSTYVQAWSPRSPTGTGTDIYVATTGNDANAGTSGSPKKTLSGADAIATPGSVVHVAAGTYQVGNNLSYLLTNGTSANRITYWSTVLHGAKITGGLSHNTQLMLIHLGGNYLDFMGFELDGSAATGASFYLSDGLYADGESPVVQYNIIHDILNNSADVARVSGSGTQHGGSGITSANWNGVQTTTVVDGNIIYNIGAPGVGSSLVHALYMYTPGTYSNNLIYNVCDGITSYHNFSAAHVLNNTIYNSAGDGIEIYSSEGTGDFCRVFNNIISGANNGIIEGYTTGTHNIYTNNTCFNCSVSSVTLQNGLTATGTSTLDPQFVDTSSLNFHLAVGSRSRAAGTNTSPSESHNTGGAATTDNIGKSRGNPMDRGCFED